MAEKIFIIYSTTSGTSTARPVMEFYNEDEDHEPPLEALGYDPARTAWVPVDPFDATDTLDEATGRSFTVNPTAFAVARTTFSRTDVATDQREVSFQIADLIQEWNWTQELDAKITRATQQAFAAWIEALEAVPANPLWATNPKGITLPTVPAVTASPLTVAQQLANAEWLEKKTIAPSKLFAGDYSNLIADDQMQDPDYWPATLALPHVQLQKSYGTGQSTRSKGAITVNRPADPSARTTIVGEAFPVEPGKSYIKSTIIGASSAPIKARAYLQFLDRDTGHTQNFAVPSPDKTTSSFETIASEGVAPSWARYARMVCIVYENGYPPSGHIVFSAPIPRRKVESGLLNDGDVPSQKLNLANWDTLQPLWGFDTDDFTPFLIGPSQAPTAALSWVAGRSGARALRVTTNGSGAIAQVDTLGIHAFATAPGETVVVEGWMRGSHNGMTCSLGLGGFANRFTSQPEQAGGSGPLTVNTGWEFFSAIVLVPAGTTRWACARFRTEQVFGAQRWIEIDGLTVKHLSRVPSAYVQTAAALDISSAQTVWDASQYVLSLNFTRNAASVVWLSAAAEIRVPSDAAGDALRTQFWLTRTPGDGAEAVLATWSEWGMGRHLNRSMSFSWVDADVPTAPAVAYHLRMSKLHSAGTVHLGNRCLQALMLPRM